MHLHESETPTRYPPWIANASSSGRGELRQIRNPFDQTVVAEVQLADDEQVEEALESSRIAFGHLRHMPRHQRAGLLDRVVVRLGEQRARFVETLIQEGGKPRMFAEKEFDRCLATFGWAAGEARRFAGDIVPMDGDPSGEGYEGYTRREPLGVILGITPFNFPLNLVAHKVAPALAAGNTILIKPAGNTPLSALLLAKAVAEAGFPSGSLNVLPLQHRQIPRLIDDPCVRMVSFTGSPEVGWQLKGRLGKQRITLELGGNSGSYVDASADLDHAVERLALGGFAQAGQSCIAVQRIYVHESIHDTFLDRLAEAARKTKAGDPTDPEVVTGPLISASDVQRVLDAISQAVSSGARLVCGGRILPDAGGQILEPTVLSHVEEKMTVCSSEIFAPVVTVAAVPDGAAAIARINDTPFGLQAALFSNDIAFIQRAIREIEAGGVIVNDFPTYRVDHMPYGGSKASGLGKEGIRSAMLEMSEEKMVVVRTGG